MVKKVDEKLNELIKIIFANGRGSYGTRRIKNKLELHYGVIVSKKRIEIRNLQKPKEHFQMKILS